MAVDIHVQVLVALNDVAALQAKQGVKLAAIHGPLLRGEGYFLNLIINTSNPSPKKTPRKYGALWGV